MDQPRFFREDDPEHVKASSLLPWYLNGTLASAECNAVDLHLRHCVQCRHELGELSSLMGVIAAEDADLSLEPALLRAQRMIDRIERTPTQIGAWTALRRLWLDGQARTRAALLLSAGLVAGVVLAVVHILTPTAEYRTLSPAIGGGQGGLQVKLVFDRAAPADRIRRVLVDLDAEIISGPARDGSYVIAIRDGRTRDIETALAQSDIVHSFALLSGETAR